MHFFFLFYTTRIYEHFYGTNRRVVLCYAYTNIIDNGFNVKYTPTHAYLYFIFLGRRTVKVTGGSRRGGSPLSPPPHDQCLYVYTYINYTYLIVSLIIGTVSTKMERVYVYNM